MRLTKYRLNTEIIRANAPDEKKGIAYDTKRDGASAGPGHGQQEGQGHSRADYFVLCSGSSAPQLKALADAGEKAMKDHGILPHHVEGHRGGTWILQDYGDVVVHVFDKEARAFYDLDRLWADAKTVDLSDVLAQPDAE